MHVIHELANLQTNFAAALSINLKRFLKKNAIPLYPIFITLFIQFVPFRNFLIVVKRHSFWTNLHFN